MSRPSYARYELIWNPGTATNCASLTRYGSSNTALTSVIQGNIVGYDQVAEYTVDAFGHNTGKTVYNYYNSADSTVTFYGFRMPGVLNLGYSLGGLLKSKTVYANNGSNTYNKVFESGFNYHTTNRTVYYNPKYEIYLAVTVGTNQDGCSGTNEPYEVHADFYPSIKSEKILLDSTKEITYDQSNPTAALTTTTYNYYDNASHYQLSRSNTKDSKGNTHVSFIKYPQDYLSGSSTGNVVLDSLIAKNMVGETIEKRDSLYLSGSSSGTVASAKASTYKLLSGVIAVDKQYKLDVTAPVSDFQGVSVSGGNITMDSRYRQMIRMDNYDNYYNITQYTSTDGVPNSFIWDYQTNYPIAQIVKASQDQVAYTSFEADGKGNWTFSGTPGHDINSLTGQRSYDLTNGSISKSGLSSGTTYIVSYWTKNSSAFSITGTISGYPVSGRTIGSWKYFEHRVTGQTTITISGSGAIDELRLYPVNALITTYTYEPLHGITSQCDANNRITYFEYDGFGRLALIKDQDKNVLKKYCYNYVGQPQGCTYYYNSQQSQVFTRNNCSTGYTGGQVTYTVAANSYSSPTSQANADAKAMEDIAANGQNYANVNGTCTPISETVQGYNTQSSSYNLKLTNNETGTNYYFTLNSGTYSNYTLGQVPYGTYTVVFYPAGSAVTCTYDINGYTYYGTGATFYNIAINAISTARMY